MKFKIWFTEQGGGATSAMHGGFYGLPNKFVNDNMPFGVRSKYVTKDGRGDWQEDPDPDIDPDLAFGYKKRPRDKKHKPETKHSDINKSRGVPIRNDRPDIIY